jgi:hypothetical protein
MAMKKDERYRCVNSKCCCEIEAVKDSSDAASVRNPRGKSKNRFLASTKVFPRFDSLHTNCDDDRGEVSGGTTRRESGVLKKRKFANPPTHTFRPQGRVSNWVM